MPRADTEAIAYIDAEYVLGPSFSIFVMLFRGQGVVVIRDNNLPVAKLVPFPAEGADEQELKLVRAGKLRLPKVRLDVKQLLKISTGRVAGNKAIQAIAADREEKL